MLIQLHQLKINIHILLNNKKEIWNLGLTLPVAKDTVLKAEYMHGDSTMEGVDDNGYVATLAYKGAKACDKSCRNHGDCPWCLENLLYKNKKKMFDFLKDLDY